MRHRYWLGVVLGLIGVAIWWALRPRPIAPDPEVEAPIERRIRVAKPARGGRSPEQILEGVRKHAELEQKLREAEARRAASSPPAAPTGAAPIAARTLDREYIQKTMKELLPLIKECYELALHGHPDLSGRLVVRFEIAGDPALGGIVERAEVVHSGAPDAGEPKSETLDECMKATIESIAFPPPEGGGRMSVTYPFVFATK